MFLCVVRVSERAGRSGAARRAAGPAAAANPTKVKVSAG